MCFIELPDLAVGKIAELLASNEVAATLRLVCKRFYFLLQSHKILQLKRPVPHHAFIKRWSAPDAWSTLTQREQFKLLDYTASTGSINNLETALEAVCSAWEPCVSSWLQDMPSYGLDLSATAIAAGHLHVYKYLRSRWNCPEGRALATAASVGPALYHELLADGCRWDVEAVYAAARSGHIELAEEQRRLHPKEVNAHQYLPKIAYGCDLPTLQHLYNKLLGGEGQEWRIPPTHEELVQIENDDEEAYCKYLNFGNELLQNAAGSPTSDWQDKFLWLRQQGFNTSVWYLNDSTAGAVWCSDAVDRLKWLLQQPDVVANGYLVEIAVEMENTAALDYLLTECQVARGRCTGPEVTAASAGHLAMLQQLRTHGWALDVTTVYAAAFQAGHLHVVEWLAAEGLLLEGNLDNFHTQEYFFKLAAASGNIKLMAWVRTRGWPWYPKVYTQAATLLHPAALEWLAEQGCPMPEDAAAAYASAAVGPFLATLRTLRRLGCPWGDPTKVFSSFVWALSRCNRSCPLVKLRYLLEAGCPVERTSALQCTSRCWFYKQELRGMLLEVRGWQEDGEERGDGVELMGVEGRKVVYGTTNQV